MVCDMLSKDKSEADNLLGNAAHPAPMGNIAKQKADGTWKHRIIQDLRKNKVNRTARIPERQVLPRPEDHAADIAYCAFNSKQDDETLVLVIDSSNAFMIGFSSSPP